MPVSNAHLERNVQVWDGLSFQTVDKDEADMLEDMGTHQITTNLQAKDLKTYEELNQRQTVETKVETAETSTAKPKARTRRKQTYKTRDLKAET